MPVARYRRKKRRVHPIVWLIGSFALLLLLAGWFYWAIQEPFWLERKEARDIILQQSSMVKIHQIHPFIEEETHYAATGEDEEGRLMVVWLSDGNIDEAYLEDHVPPTIIRQRLLNEHPEAEIIRIVPGLFEKERAWEVFYKVPEEEGHRYCYAYYRFEDGEKLDTYRLSVR